MKALLISAVFIFMCAASCTKALQDDIRPVVDIFKKYSVPLKMELYAERSDKTFNADLNNSTRNPINGVWDTKPGVDLLTYLKNGGQVDIVLSQFIVDEDGNKTITGTGIVKVLFSKGAKSGNVLSGTAGWSSSNFTGTLDSRLNPASGSGAFKYTFATDVWSYDTTEIILDGLMKK